MFSIFNKPKTITIDCFTNHAYSYELFPIEKATKFFPDWWKKLPGHFDTETEAGIVIPQRTMKGCAGLTNLYANGIVMPLWSDLLIETRGTNFAYQFADNVSQVGLHALDQLGEEFSQYTHTKIISPWRIREKSGVNFMYMDLPWNHPKDLMNQCTPPGLVEYKYQHTTNVNMFLRKGAKYMFKAGRPMAHIIPMTDAKVELKCHLVGDNEIEKIMSNLSFPFFIDGYARAKALLKKKAKG
jgi:hypothetical protein